MEKLPEDRVLFYISIFGIPKTACNDDIYDAFPEACIHNIFQIEDIPGAYDLQFKDRTEVVKAIDCKADTIKGEIYTIKLS